MIDNVIQGAFGASPAPGELSPRERQVLILIAQGLSNNDIAETMFLGINTIKTYVRTAYRKIGATSRTRAVIWVLDSGLIDDDLDQTGASTRTAPKGL
jgi:NarL family two-component system response regulator LiaR